MTNTTTTSPEAQQALADLERMKQDFLAKFAATVAQIRGEDAPPAPTPQADALPTIDGTLTLAEVSKILHVTGRTLLNYIQDGRIRAQKIGGRWRVTKDNLQAFIEGRNPA